MCMHVPNFLCTFLTLSLRSERRRRGGEAEDRERDTIPERGNRAAGEEEGKMAVSSGANVGHPEH